MVVLLPEDLEFYLGLLSQFPQLIPHRPVSQRPAQLLQLAGNRRPRSTAILQRLRLLQFFKSGLNHPKIQRANRQQNRREEGYCQKTAFSFNFIIFYSL